MAANQQAIQRYAVIGDQDFGAFLQRRGQEFNELLKEDRVQFTCQDAPHGWKHQVPNARHYASVNKRESNPNNIQMNVACWLGTVSHLDAQEDVEVALRAVENALSMIFDLERTCVQLRKGYPEMSYVNQAFLRLIYRYWNANQIKPANVIGDSSDEGQEIDEGNASDVEDVEDLVADQAVVIRRMNSPHRYVVIWDLHFGDFLQSAVADLNQWLTPGNNGAPEIALSVQRAPGWSFPENPGNLYNPSEHDNNRDCYLAKVRHANNQELVGFFSEWLNLMNDIMHNIVLRNEAEYHGVNAAWATMVERYADTLQGQNQNQ